MTELLATIAYGDYIFWGFVFLLVVLNVALYFRSDHIYRHAQRVYKNGFKAYDDARKAWDGAKASYNDTIVQLKAWDAGPACAWCGHSADWARAAFLSEVGQREIRVLVEHLPDNTVKASVIECKWAPDLVGKSAEGSDSYKAHDALRALLVKAVAT